MSRYHFTLDWPPSNYSIYLLLKGWAAPRLWTAPPATLCSHCLIFQPILCASVANSAHDLQNSFLYFSMFFFHFAFLPLVVTLLYFFFIVGFFFFVSFLLACLDIFISFLGGDKGKLFPFPYLLFLLRPGTCVFGILVLPSVDCLRSNNRTCAPKQLTFVKTKHKQIMVKVYFHMAENRKSSRNNMSNQQ